MIAEFTRRVRAPQAPTSLDRGHADLQSLICSLSPVCRAALLERIQSIVAALGGGAPSAADLRTLLTALTGVLTPVSHEKAWLTIAVLTGDLPDTGEVLRTFRAMRLDGPLQALLDVLDSHGCRESDDWPRVEIVTNQVLVDVHHTSRNIFATGIQRVAREVARRWVRDHHLVLIGWTPGYKSLRRLTSNEVSRVLTDVDPNDQGTDELGFGRSPDTSVVVPWRSTHLMPELPAEPGRAGRYQGLVTFSRSATGLIGYDCVPLTAAETAAEGMAGAFANFLAAAAKVNRIATISESTALEYRAWRTMLSGAGHAGPDIEAIPLAVEARVPTDAALQEARTLLGVGSIPIVLSVGSHEPRKNHAAVLYAAELLWREGLMFSLTFVGGNAWRSEQFLSLLERLRGVNRPVQVIRALRDDVLWAAYRIAYCTVFPSLHEGFGLPVAESLASGTPVVTSSFGSMKEIADHGAALLVDSHDDQQIADAIRRLLEDESLRDRLAAEASRLRTRSWDDYAAETWEYLVHPKVPDERD